MASTEDAAAQRGTESAASPCGRVEVVRRVLLYVGLFGALWTGLGFAPELFSVGAVDFEKDHARNRGKPIVGEHYAAMSLQEFIAQRTRDNVIQVEGAAWAALADGVEAALAGKGGPEWDRRFGSGYADQRLYFRPDEPPLAELAGRITAKSGFSYVRLPAAAGGRYLAVTHVEGTDLALAPWAVSRPLRSWSPALLLVGLLGYVLLPWPRHPVAAVRYSLARGAILPDAAGVLLAAVFFGLPLLVLSGGGGPDLGGGALDFSNGAGWFTLVFWLLAGFGVAMSAVAAYYASFQLLALPEGIRRSTLFGRQDVPFSGIASAELVEHRPSRWFVLLALLSGKGHLMGLAMDRQVGIGLRLKDGRLWRLWLRGLENEETLAAALGRASVALSQELADVAKDAPEPKATKGTTGRGHRTVQAVFAILFLALGLWLAAQVQASPPRHQPPRPPEPLPDPAVMIERTRILREMQQISAAMTPLLERIKSGTEEERRAAGKDFQELQRKFQALQERSQNLDKPKPAAQQQDAGGPAQ